MCVGSLAGLAYLRYTVLTSSNKSETAVHCTVAILLYRFLSCWCLETFFRRISLAVFCLYQEFPASSFKAMHYGIGAPEKHQLSNLHHLLHEYSFQLRLCLPLIHAVFFHWNTSFTPFILVSNSINWRVNQFFSYLRLSRKNCDLQLYEF